MSARKRRLFIIAMIAVGFLGGVVVADVAFTGGEPAGGDVPLGAADGPLVVGTDVSNTEVTEFTPNANTVDVTSDVGNATLSSNGRTNVTLDTVTGPWTNASDLDVASTPLTIDPADKPAVVVSGDAERVNFRTMTVDDGTPDFEYGGSSGSTTVTVNGLSASAVVAAVDVNSGRVLDAKTPSGGQATFTMPNSNHTVTLQTSAGPPTLSNASPTGALSTKPSTVSVDVDDPDFPQDNVTVTATLNGSTLGTTTVNDTGTASISIGSLTAGKHQVEITAQDAF